MNMVINGNEAEHPEGEDPLNELAREAIRAGRVPMREPDRMWGGDGGGAPCSVCAAPVEGTASGFELEFKQKSGDAQCHHLHVPCYAAWVVEFLRMSAGSA
jgi:hypothetical protein